MNKYFRLILSIALLTLSAAWVIRGQNITGADASGNLSILGNFTASRYISNVVTGTAPLQVASTTPVANLTASNHATNYTCGTLAACSPTQQTGFHWFFGSVALNGASPSLATVTGFSPAFSSTTSYFCTVEDAAGVAATEVTRVSGSSITITGPNTSTDVTVYMCVGN